MDRITVAIAGGSGFIGRAIVRRLGDTARVRVLTRNPDAVRARLAGTGAEFVRADVTDAASLEAAIAGDDRDEINAAAEALETLSKPFAERRMDRGIREALAGVSVSDLERRVGE